MKQPVMVELYCGLGGWTEGFLAEGWKCFGFDLERHVYGEHKYPAQLVLQDVLTMHGCQLKDVDMICSSSPCQKYSYMAMPWKRAKAMAAKYREDIGDLNALFDAQFRIQREASAAAGRKIPMIVENVRGAQPWVGRAAYNYGSFYLWGNIPALMPAATRGAMKLGITHRPNGKTNFHASAKRATKNEGDTFGWPKETPLRDCNSKSPRRKAASAMIAKIPFELSSHIARVYRPRSAEGPTT